MVQNNTQLLATLDAVEASSEFVVSGRDFIFKLAGTFSATVNLEIYNDSAADWQIVETYTAAAVKVVHSPAAGQRFRANCSAFTSGAAKVEFVAANESTF